jgi:sugar phosphate permease
MLEKILYSIVTLILLFAIAYGVGRFFSSGIMDGINHKLNQFTKSTKNDNKEEEQ